MRKYFILASALLSASVYAEDSQKEVAVFDKMVEIQQHSRLSIHLDDKCKYLNSKERNDLEFSSEKLGALIATHPMNNLGEKAYIFIDTKMHERSRDIPCNAAAKAEVEDTLRVTGQFLELLKNP
jgi:hypothetical protein